MDLTDVTAPGETNWKRLDWHRSSIRMPASWSEVLAWPQSQYRRRPSSATGWRNNNEDGQARAQLFAVTSPGQRPTLIRCAWSICIPWADRSPGSIRECGPKIGKSGSPASGAKEKKETLTWQRRSCREVAHRQPKAAEARLSHAGITLEER